VYSSRNYNEAIDLYTKAIMCNADPVFYSNRAACRSPTISPPEATSTFDLTANPGVFRPRSSETVRQNHRRRLRCPDPKSRLSQSPPTPRPRLRRNRPRHPRSIRLDSLLHPRGIPLHRCHRGRPTRSKTLSRIQSR